MIFHIKIPPYKSTFVSDKVEIEEASSEGVPKGRQIAISRLSGRGGNLFIPSNGIDLKNILKNKSYKSFQVLTLQSSATS